MRINLIVGSKVFSANCHNFSAWIWPLSCIRNSRVLANASNFYSSNTAGSITQHGTKTLGLGLLCSNMSWLCYASVLTEWLYYAFPTVSLCLNCIHSQAQYLSTVVLNWIDHPFHFMLFWQATSEFYSSHAQQGKKQSRFSCVVFTSSTNIETEVTIQRLL